MQKKQPWKPTRWVLDTIIELYEDYLRSKLGEIRDIFYKGLIANYKKDIESLENRIISNDYAFNKMLDTLVEEMTEEQLKLIKEKTGRLFTKKLFGSSNPSEDERLSQEVDEILKNAKRFPAYTGYEKKMAVPTSLASDNKSGPVKASGENLFNDNTVGTVEIDFGKPPLLKVGTLKEAAAAIDADSGINKTVPYGGRFA